MSQPPMYTTEPIVRQALQKIGEGNISAEFINQAIQSATSDCDLFSGRSWTSSDQYYQSIVGACIQLATAYSIAIQNGKDVRQMNEYNMAKDRLTFIYQRLIDSGVITFPETLGGTEITEPTTFPANPDGEIVIAVTPVLPIRPKSTDPDVID